MICLLSPQLVAASDPPLVIDCALVRPSENNAAYCNDVNDLVTQVIVIGRYLLGLAGSIALVMFIYGGFVFLTAMGRSEQAKKGQQVLAAAVIGLIITLSAYLIIDFVVGAFGVSSYFTGS